MKTFIYVTLSLNPFPRERDFSSLRSKLSIVCISIQCLPKWQNIPLNMDTYIYAQSLCQVLNTEKPDKFNDF